MGQASYTLDGATLVALGYSTAQGELVVTLDGVTGDALGEFEDGNAGQLSTNLAGVTLTAVGQSTVLGSLGITLEGVTGAGVGEQTLSTEASLSLLLTQLADVTARLVRIENQLIADTIKGATRYQRLLPGTSTVILDKDVIYDPETGFTLTEHEEPPP